MRPDPSSTTPDAAPPPVPFLSRVATTDPLAEEYGVDSPVRPGPGDDQPVEGVGLCLSGGGYRAMLFHVGLLWRLNEAGWLARLDRVSSVSGGSITAGVLGLNWGKLGFDANGVAADFAQQVVAPIREMAGTRVDVTATLEGLVAPGVSAADRVASRLGDKLFGVATLQDLPDEPRFVINSTNLETGHLLRFSKPYLADYSVGEVLNPTTRLAHAVAASAAFPPFLSPYTLEVDQPWTTVEGDTNTSDGFRDKIRLSDGGVYDNLGLETVWKKYRTVLVSDAGGLFVTDEEPPTDWARQMLRVLHVIDSQVRSLRRQQVIGSFHSKDDPHDGFYVSTTSDLSKLPVGARAYLPASPDVTRRLADLDTRLWPMPEADQELLINWGYVATDGLLLATLAKDLPAGTLPYPDRPLG